MDFSNLTGVIAAIAALSGILLGWLGHSRSKRNEVAQAAGVDAVQRADVEYIKRGVDDIKVDVRVQGQRMDGFAERLTRVEESAKQAHKRLDKLEDK